MYLPHCRAVQKVRRIRSTNGSIRRCRNRHIEGQPSWTEFDIQLLHTFWAVPSRDVTAFPVLTLWHTKQPPTSRTQSVPQKLPKSVTKSPNVANPKFTCHAMGPCRQFYGICYGRFGENRRTCQHYPSQSAPGGSRPWQVIFDLDRGGLR